MKSLPKRRKKKDNPYTLLYEAESNRYFILFKDVRNVINKVEVNIDVFNAFDRFELDDISELHKIDKHIDMRELDENKNYENDTESIDDFIIRKSTYEELHKAINKLTETQKRRIKYYYFDDMKFSDIARVEECDESSVRESIYAGIEKLKKILK
jgi:RNA polymerase sigma factor (sigma-70 family)